MMSIDVILEVETGAETVGAVWRIVLMRRSEVRKSQHFDMDLLNCHSELPAKLSL
jgi:hypothetical protein